MGKPPLPEDCPASLPASLSRPRNQQTQPRPFAILPRQGFSWQDGSCATQLHPARGKSLWTPSCSALRFSHEKGAVSFVQSKFLRFRGVSRVNV